MAPELALLNKKQQGERKGWSVAKCFLHLMRGLERYGLKRHRITRTTPPFFSCNSSCPSQQRSAYLHTYIETSLTMARYQKILIIKGQ